MIAAVCLVLMLVGIVGSAYFSGLETGAYCLNKLRLRMRVEEGDARARLLAEHLDDPQVFITALLIGTNASVYLATAALTHLGRTRGWEFPSVTAALVLAPVLLVFSEAIPKNIFRRNAEVLLYRTVGFTRWAVTALEPLARVLSKLVPLGERGVHSWRERFFSLQRLKYLFLESTEEGVLTPYQNVIGENILSLRERLVKSVMIPLGRIAAIEGGAGKEEVLRMAKRYGFSRFPVYRKDRWNIVGTVDLFDALGEEGFSLEEATRDAPVLSPGDTVASALIKLRAARKPMAIVRDSSGRAVGLVTMKDLVEEIVGELAEW